MFEKNLVHIKKNSYICIEKFKYIINNPLNIIKHEQN